MILITGSSGLIGRGISAALRLRGVATRGFDLCASESQDTRDAAALDEALDGVSGVVHLAAVSRVVSAQTNPDLANATNVDALKSLLTLVQQKKTRPWIIFASSREVYGQAASLPVCEDAPLAPMNVYARTKAKGERLIEEARRNGLHANIVRFSNVYGDILDHADRVVPAFARTAAMGGCLRVDGASNVFDFTHIDDCVSGLDRLVKATAAGRLLPPLHLVTGKGTTLGELATMAVQNSRAPVTVRQAPPRTFDVAQFVGDPARSRELLGWTPTISIEDGMAQLIDDFHETRSCPHNDLGPQELQSQSFV